MKYPRAKRAIAAKMLHNATLHLHDYGYYDVAVNVARLILMDAERRVLNDLGPVPQQDCESYLEIERKYTTGKGV